MPYLLHARSRLEVFTTRDRNIARFLRHNHHWAVVKIESDQIPVFVSSSCIAESEDNAVSIDENVLSGGKALVEQLVGLLEKDGFEEPDLVYVGRLVRTAGKVREGEGGAEAGSE